MTAYRVPYGIGLAYRNVLHRQIMARDDLLDMMEVTTLDYVHRYRSFFGDPHHVLLQEIIDKYPTAAHGITMSIGSVEQHDKSLMWRTRSFLDRHHLYDLSEHMSFHRMQGTDLESFISMPWDELSVRWIAEKYRLARAALGRPIGFENVSYDFPIPGSSLTEAQFLTRLTEETDCSLLVDATNVFNNAKNFGFDPIEFIRALPGHRVRHVHLAGGHFSRGKWIDSHRYKVMPQVWEILEEIMRSTSASVVILERDSRYDSTADIWTDLAKARDIFYKYRPAQAPEQPEPVFPEPVASEDDLDLDVDGDWLKNPELIQLRSLQEATVAIAANRDLFKLWEQSPEQVADQFHLEGRWRDRWLQIDRKALRDLPGKYFDRLNNEQRIMRDVKAAEWQAWANETG